MKDEQIKPCPLCKAALLKPLPSAFGRIGCDFWRQCDECGLSGPHGATYEEGNKRWNELALAVLAGTKEGGLTFSSFREANVARCLKWHPQGINSWSASDWMTALVGEVGELSSLLKMRNRERDGLPGNKFSPTDRQVADELADIQAYLDLLAASLGIDLGLATARKFNEVSERVGFSDRINLPELK